MNERLYRSRDERIVAGVAGGVAERFNVDPSLVRILWLILVPATAGFALLLYVIMAFVVPEEPAGDARWAAWQRQSGVYQWPDLTGTGGGGAASATTVAAGAGHETASAVGAETAAGTGPDAASTGARVSTGAGVSGPPVAAWPGQAAPRPAQLVSSEPPPTPPSPSAHPTPPPSDDWWTRDTRPHPGRADRAKGWDGSGAVLFGLILIVAGGYFFARTYLPDIDVNRTWPIILVVLGGILLIGSIRRSSGRSG